MIRSEHMKSCLAALIRFMLFKGPGSLKNFFFNRRKCRRMKGLSIDTTHTPPLFSFYTTFKAKISRNIKLCILFINRKKGVGERWGNKLLICEVKGPQLTAWLVSTTLRRAFVLCKWSLKKT
jgi:hypothetical protein